MIAQRRKGFTLIELLIVVVIIGILAAIAIPKFRNSKGKSYAASMRSDLRNLSTAQEAFYYDSGYYASDVNSLTFSHSPGVILTVEEANAKGWAAIASHPQAWPLTCALFMGSVSTLPDPATDEGIAACR
jgi:type IV pilus assembly protein PilA